jgi:hypothetical protein
MHGCQREPGFFMMMTRGDAEQAGQDSFPASSSPIGIGVGEAAADAGNVLDSKGENEARGRFDQVLEVKSCYR